MKTKKRVTIQQFKKFTVPRMEKMFALVDEWNRRPNPAITRECLEIEKQVNEFLNSTNSVFTAPRSIPAVATKTPDGKVGARIQKPSLIVPVPSQPAVEHGIDPRGRHGWTTR